MTEGLFAALDRALASPSPAGALDLLIAEFREGGSYALLFEARNMKKRLELGLPLIQTEDSSTFPAEARAAYEQAMIEAAREAGELYLAAGNIPAGYRYLRAIGETAAVADALEQAQPGDDFEAVVAIAFQEGVHPARGLELILRQHGMCRAITAFGMYAVAKDRDRCIRLLVTELHAEIAGRMARVIEQQEGSKPDARNLPALMSGRDWLFGEYDYYVDTSHLTSLLPYALETTDAATLQLFGELCEYGRHLSPNFHFKDQPPFEDGYTDYGCFVDAVLGRDAGRQIEHFRRKAEACDPEADGTNPAQVLVNLLVRLERYADALEAFQQFLASEDPARLQCPGALHLCHMAKQYDRLRLLARERGDLLSYAAASLSERVPPGTV